VLKIALLFFLASPLLAAPRFEALRHDPMVPEHCRQVQVAHFQDPYEHLYYGIDGAKNKGFTHEIDLQRKEARLFWLALYYQDAKAIQAIRQERDLLEIYSLMRAVGDYRGIDFSKEGDVLEVMVLVDIIRHYPAKDYYTTGGIEYGDDQKKPVMGEIDILIAHKKTCRVVAIGEAKLGLNALPKAKRQVRRVDHFIDRYQISD